jgi:hypothetical protein
MTQNQTQKIEQTEDEFLEEYFKEFPKRKNMCEDTTTF